MSLFGMDELKRFVIAISIYLLSILILVILYRIGFPPIGFVSNQITDFLYLTNIFLALSFCILITVNFASFNKKINVSLIEKNLSLIENENLLRSEISERKITGKKLEESLSEIEILLSETHHRVKNNLAVVSGMLDLQLLSSEDEQIKTVLTDSRNRIKSMSLIHESLYQFNNLAQIEFGRYLYTLTDEIRKTYPSLSNNIILNREFDTIHLSVSRAIPCGLLVNEILSNAYKYAFVGRVNGIINMSFVKEDEDYVLIIKDNGVGFDKKESDTNSSMGTSLIEAFSKQLKGEYLYTIENGTIFKFKFKA